MIIPRSLVIVLVGLIGSITGLAADCITLSLAPQDWQQVEFRHGPLEPIQTGLLLRGDAWTNARNRNGRIDGNHVRSARPFDLRGGGDVYLVFSVDGGGQYMAIFPLLFSGVEVPHMTTHHSFRGSVVLPERQWLYAQLHVDVSGNYQITVCQNTFFNQDGRVLLDRAGTLTSLTGRVEFAFADNYAGPSAFVVIGKAMVCPAGSRGVRNGGGDRGGFESLTTAGGGSPNAAVGYVGPWSSQHVTGRMCGHRQW